MMDKLVQNQIDEDKVAIESNAILHNKSVRFWLLQCCGWSVFYCLQLPIFGDDNWLSPASLIYAGSVTLLGILGSLLIRKIFTTVSRHIFRGDIWALLIIIISLLVAIMIDLLHHSFWFLISLKFEQFSVIYQSQSLMVITGFLWLTYLFWGSLYLALSKQETLKTVMIKQQQLELLVKENKIKDLLEQLNPHFMFNTINNIRALILKDTEQAREMLASFADIMRYQINSNNEALVKLEDELNFVTQYIELNRLQLGKRLLFTQDVDMSLLNNFIPRMAIQLLVENAIKHGFSLSSAPAMLKIIIQSEPTTQHPQAWFIAVENSGYLNQMNNTNSGIGLINLEERLKISFDNNYKLTLYQENDIVKCKILFNY